MKHQRDEDEVDDQNETDMQHSNPFMTARDQYVSRLYSALIHKFVFEF